MHRSLPHATAHPPAARYAVRPGPGYRRARFSVALLFRGTRPLHETAGPWGLGESTGSYTARTVLSAGDGHACTLACLANRRRPKGHTESHKTSSVLSVTKYTPVWLDAQALATTSTVLRVGSGWPGSPGGQRVKKEDGEIVACPLPRLPEQGGRAVCHVDHRAQLS